MIFALNHNSLILIYEIDVMQFVYQNALTCAITTKSQTFSHISPILKSLHCLNITDTQTLTQTHTVYACKCVSIVYTYMCFKIVESCGYLVFVPCYVDWHNSTACGFIYGTFKHRSSSFAPWYQSRQCDVKWRYSSSSGNKEQAFGGHGPASSQQGTSRPKDNGE